MAGVPSMNLFNYHNKFALLKNGDIAKVFIVHNIIGIMKDNKLLTFVDEVGKADTKANECFSVKKIISKETNPEYFL